jgi:hypothetical protein
MTGMGGFETVRFRTIRAITGHSAHGRVWPIPDRQLSVIRECKQTFATPEVSSQFDPKRPFFACQIINGHDPNDNLEPVGKRAMQSCSNSKPYA